MVVIINNIHNANISDILVIVVVVNIKYSLQ